MRGITCGTTSRIADATTKILLLMANVEVFVHGAMPVVVVLQSHP
jgi:hypothetical protein